MQHCYCQKSFCSARVSSAAVENHLLYIWRFEKTYEPISLIFRLNHITTQLMFSLNADKVNAISAESKSC